MSAWEAMFLVTRHFKKNDYLKSDVIVVTYKTDTSLIRTFGSVPSVSLYIREQNTDGRLILTAEVTKKKIAKTSN